MSVFYLALIFQASYYDVSALPEKPAMMFLDYIIDPSKKTFFACFLRYASYSAIALAAISAMTVIATGGGEYLLRPPLPSLIASQATLASQSLMTIVVKKSLLLPAYSAASYVAFSVVSFCVYYGILITCYGHIYFRKLIISAQWDLWGIYKPRKEQYGLD